MTGEGTFRILTAASTQMVARAAEIAQSSPAVTGVYGRLLTGTALLQLAQSPIDRVQCALEHGGAAGHMLADVWPGPAVRGRIEDAAPSSGAVLGSDCVIRVSRQPARGGPLYQSAVPAKAGCVADALQQYTMESEQVLTFFSLVTVLAQDGTVTQAGGIIVQALPGWERDHLAQVIRCLEKARFDDLVEAGDTPFDAAMALFGELSLHETGTDPLIYQCRCSKQVAINAVHTLNDEELAALRVGGSEKVTCDFCGTAYTVVGSDLEAP